MLGERRGLGGVDGQGDLAEGDAGDFGGVDEAAAGFGLDDDAVEDVFAGVVQDAVDGADGDAVGGDDGDAAGEGLVADLVVVVGAQGAEISGGPCGQTSTTSRTVAVRQEMRESSGRTLSSKRPVSSCSSSMTRAWKRRPRLVDLDDVAGPMPLEVVRRVDGADGSTVSRGSGCPPWRATLCGGADGLPDAGVEVDVLGRGWCGRR